MVHYHVMHGNKTISSCINMMFLVVISAFSIEYDIDICMNDTKNGQIVSINLI